MLLILSDNRDFIEPVSALVTRELGLVCKSIQDEAEIKSEAMAVVVCERALVGSYDVPVIRVNFPIKINQLLFDKIQ